MVPAAAAAPPSPARSSGCSARRRYRSIHPFMRSKTSASRWAGRAWARFEDGQVVFKAEIGAQTSRVGQIQGVWVHPDWRGRGLGAAGTAALAAAVLRSGRTASLYVNDFNAPARAIYRRIGFGQLGTYATVLLD